MNKKRLEHLRDVVVPNIDQEKIRMSNYFSRDSTDDECGTCACLAGHACYDDQFKKEGLYTIILYKRLPAYGGFIGYTAMEKFFGLHSEAAIYLFGANESGKKEHIISRINRVLGENA